MRRTRKQRSNRSQSRRRRYFGAGNYPPIKINAFYEKYNQGDYESLSSEINANNMITLGNDIDKDNIVNELSSGKKYPFFVNDKANSTSFNYVKVYFLSLDELIDANNTNLSYNYNGDNINVLNRKIYKYIGDNGFTFDNNIIEKKDSNIKKDLSHYKIFLENILNDIENAPPSDIGESISEVPEEVPPMIENSDAEMPPMGPMPAVEQKLSLIEEKVEKISAIETEISDIEKRLAALETKTGGRRRRRRTRRSF
jgi:hypothetical protein